LSFVKAVFNDIVEIINESRSNDYIKWSDAIIKQGDGKSENLIEIEKNMKSFYKKFMIEDPSFEIKGLIHSGISNIMTLPFKNDDSEDKKREWASLYLFLCLQEELPTP
jgi:hypothetical protein